MSNNTGDLLQQLADREAIRERLYRYCRSMDRVDAPLGQSVFHEDATADYGPVFKGRGRDMIAHICAVHTRKFLHHSHQLSNILIDLDGDKAGSEAYVTATLRMMDDGRLQQRTIWARYIDRWSRRGNNWGIDNRRVLFDFDEIRDVVTASSFEDARRDRDDPSYAAIRSVA